MSLYLLTGNHRHFGIEVCFLQAPNDSEALTKAQAEFARHRMEHWNIYEVPADHNLWINNATIVVSAMVQNLVEQARRENWRCLTPVPA